MCYRINLEHKDCNDECCEEFRLGWCLGLHYIQWLRAGVEIDG